MDRKTTNEQKTNAFTFVYHIISSCHHTNTCSHIIYTISYTSFHTLHSSVVGTPLQKTLNYTLRQLYRIIGHTKYHTGPPGPIFKGLLRYSCNAVLHTKWCRVATPNASFRFRGALSLSLFDEIKKKHDYGLVPFQRRSLDRIKSNQIKLHHHFRDRHSLLLLHYISSK